MSTPAIQLHHRVDDDPRRGFTTPRDFLLACFGDRDAHHRDQVSDYRLRSLTVRGMDTPGALAYLLPAAFTPASFRAAAGSDEQGEYADPYGGFAVPPPTVTPFALSAVESDPTAGRTLLLPMSTPFLDVLCRVDKDHSTSVSGGLTVARTAETLPRTSSRMGLEVVSLKATSLFGLAFATEELLVDSLGAFIAILEAAYRDELSDRILREKISGGGGNEYLGVLNAGCKIEVAKEGGQAADTIVAENVVAMAARCWGYNRAVWLANYDCRSQLAQAAYLVEGAAGGGLISVFSPATREGEPDFLHGRPCFFSEHTETLGDAGDIALVNWSQYLEGLYQPLQSAESIHVRFVAHERAFKLWLRNAGAPWWRAALTPEKGANTLSPIVTLAERT